MRWFISYRYTVKGFLDSITREIKCDNIIIDITPTQWIAKQGNKYIILYAEKISLALASELIYGGAGVPIQYFNSEE